MMDGKLRCYGSCSTLRCVGQRRATSSRAPAIERPRQRRSQVSFRLTHVFTAAFNRQHLRNSTRRLWLLQLQLMQTLLGRFATCRSISPCTELNFFALASRAAVASSHRRFGGSSAASDRKLGWHFESKEDIENRRRWRDAFSHKDLFVERAGIETSFTRSSGPGGQHVNKTSSKAVVRLDLGKVTASAPTDPIDLDRVVDSQRWLLPTLAAKLALDSSYYAPSTHSLLFTSSQSRSQHSNLADALSRMHSHILQVASLDLPGETSESQAEKVAKLQAREKRKLKQVKEKRKDLKKGRGKVAL